MLLFLCVVFVLSGAAGLVYESIWTRYLGLFVGHSAYAQVLVLVIFLGGMSAGAMYVGRRSERVKNPLVWYALVELAVGIIGLVFHDAFVWTTHFAYDTLFPALGPGPLHSFVKWLIAALLILPQSILLGATFPLMTAGALRRAPDRAGRTISLLYFANSLGAAGGVLLAGFVLIQAAGLPGTLAAAAMLNLIVAGAVLLVTRREGSGLRDSMGLAPRGERVAEATATISAAPEEPQSRGLITLLLLVSFGTAVSSFIYEIGWIRMLSLVLGSATHSFELMLSAFILGLSCGAFAIRTRSDSGAASLRTLGYVQLAMGALAVATLPLYVQSFEWMADFMAAFTRNASGYRAFSMSRYFICLVVMLPATFCAGMTLPLITKLLMRGRTGERSIGLVYAVNTLGSIVGVTLAALVLLPVLGLKWLLVGGAAIDVALGVALLMWERRGAPEWVGQRRFAPAMVIVGLMFLVGARANFDRGVLTSGVFRYGNAKAPRQSDMVYYADGRTATVSVRRILSSRGLSLATNGKPDASLGPEWFRPPMTPGPFTHDASTQMLLPLILLAHAPQAQKAAVIGLGSGMSSHTLLQDPRLKSLVTIEIEPEMIKGARAFYPANRLVFDDTRSTFALDDARSYFASQGEKYDVILSEPSTPWVAGVSGLFTTEFYAHVKRFLAPKGMFGQWLHLSEINDGLVLSVIRAVAENFPSYVVYSVGNRDILIVAANDSTIAPPDWSVFQLPPVAEALKRVYPLTVPILDALHMVDGATLEPLVRGGGGNSDFYPSLDLGAERTRYMNEGASGFVGLTSDRFAIAPIMEGRRAGVTGERYTPISFVPRLEAMELAARVRDNHFSGASRQMLGTVERARAVDRTLASNVAPLDWHEWAAAVRDAEETYRGGTSGVVDSAFFAAAQRFMDAQKAPPEARATIAFLHGLASWDFAEVSKAADVLIPAAEKDDLWMPVDLLREGTAVARIKLGDPVGARFALDHLASRKQRDANDVRPQLLAAWIDAASAPRRPSAMPVH
ncbi:MAG: Spermine synthase [Gemmatimonadetes bacterium]|nr:Spermine synthase [Gemmatimonadota bacterium]